MATGSLVLMALMIVGARSAGLVADLSNRLIAITTAFAGAEVLLFGALEMPGADVAVIVRGPTVTERVRRKARTVGVWLNRDEVPIKGVPHYYAVASNRPLSELASESELARHQIGVERVKLEAADGVSIGRSELQVFSDALRRNKERSSLWLAEVGKVTFLGDRLFRTTLDFPTGVLPGNYQVQVLELRDGVVVSAQSSALIISKVGLEADIFNFAHKQSVLYGLLSILIAVGAGWLAATIFQKR